MLLTFFKSLKVDLINMVAILMMSAKSATPDLLKIKVFWNKRYYVIHVTIKNLSRDLNYLVDAFMWPMFGNSSISMREVIIIWILQGSDKKKQFFWGVFLELKFNNLGLTVDVALRFYISVATVLKLKLKKFWGIVFTLGVYVLPYTY